MIELYTFKVEMSLPYLSRVAEIIKVICREDTAEEKGADSDGNYENSSEKHNVASVI